MKNIVRTNLNTIDNPQAFIEFQIMDSKNDKVLKSLGNPETSQDALSFVETLLDKKYKNIIPKKQEVLFRIIAESFLNNRKIEDQLAIFAQQVSPKVAQAKVETGFVVAKFAYDAYQPENNIDYSEKLVA